MSWSIASSASGPHLTILVNGGIETLDQAEAHLRHVDGVMLGRAAYQNPALLARGGCALLRRRAGGSGRGGGGLLPIMSNGNCAQGARLHPLIKPMLGLYNGRPGARLFRRHLSEQAPRARRRHRRAARGAGLCAAARTAPPKRL